MAGAIRQPIDIPALQRYVEQHAPQIKTPFEVKQVGHVFAHGELVTHTLQSLDSVNRIPRIYSYLQMARNM